MAIQRIQYATVNQKARDRKILIILAVLLCLGGGGWIAGGLGGAATFLVIGIVPLCIWFMVNRGQEFALATTHLRNDGIHADLRVGDVLIDSRQKRFAFVNATLRHYDLHASDDILSWRGINDQLIFQTRNINNPVYKVQLQNKAQQELWFARISAVMAGGR